jgi:UDP-N-acetyl-D-glucosamine dehydrogenase
MGIFSRRSHEVRLQSVKLTDDAIREADCVVIAVAHSTYDFERIVSHAKLVVDTVNATKRVEGSHDKVVLI